MNKQNWLTEKVPSDWCDKVELIPLVLFECLVHFVEEEGFAGQSALDCVYMDHPCDFEEYREDHEKAQTVRKAVREELEWAYNHIKARPALLEELDKAYPEPILKPIPNYRNGEIISYSLPPTEELYGTKEPFKRANEIENEIKTKDLKAMLIIVNHYEYLWT